MKPEILTSTGVYFDFLNPQKGKNDIEWIANALSKIPRFNGHTKFAFSVAQHSVLVSKLVPIEHAFEALMHDMTEAVLCDIPTPLKQYLPDYQRIEKNLDKKMRSWFGLPEEMHPDIKLADRKALAIEKHHLLPKIEDQWEVLQGLDVDPTQFTFEELNWRQSKYEFISRFKKLCPSHLWNADIRDMKPDYNLTWE